MPERGSFPRYPGYSDYGNILPSPLSRWEFSQPKVLRARYCHLLALYNP